jgi:hypothetical protein
MTYQEDFSLPSEYLEQLSKQALGSKFGGIVCSVLSKRWGFARVVNVVNLRVLYFTPKY